MPPTTNQVNISGNAGIGGAVAQAVQVMNVRLLEFSGQAHRELSGAILSGILAANRAAGKGVSAATGGKGKSGADAAADGQNKLALAYGLASAALLKYINAGISGTTVGEHLSFQFQELNRQIAALFLPAIEKVIQKLTQLTQWFRNLSGEQQQQIGRWLGVGTAMLGLLTIGPKLVSMFKFIGGAMQAAMIGNPLLTLLAGMGLLMAQSEGGRESLMKLGNAAMDAFGALAEILVGVVLPIVEYFVELLSKPQGQLLALGLVATMAAGRVVAAARAMAAGFMTVQGAIGLIGVALGALFLIGGGNAGGALGKTFDDIAAQVRSGKKKVDDARKEVEDLATEQAHKEREELAGGRELNEIAIRTATGKSSEQIEEERRKQLATQGQGKIDRAAGGAQRSDVVQARTGTESNPLQVIRRIEDSVLKTGLDPKRTADATEGIFDWLKAMQGVLGGANKDNRDQPPKAD